MAYLHGVLAVTVLLAIAVAFSDARGKIRLRSVFVALALQFGSALIVLRWSVGRQALDWASGLVNRLIGYTTQGTAFVFGPLAQVGGNHASIFALQVLTVVVFLGAIIRLLFYLRVIQYLMWLVGGLIATAMRISRLEAFYAATVIILGQTEAPLTIAAFLPEARRSQLFTVMAGGFAAAAGSTLVGYSLLGAPLPYLLAASLMNAPASLLMAAIMSPGGGAGHEEIDVRTVRDQESANGIDALARGALTGGRIAVTVGALLIASVAVIALLNDVLHGIGTLLGDGTLSLQEALGWLFAPIAWLIGAPWAEATQVGTYIGIKTVVNEFVAYSEFGPNINQLSPSTVAIVTVALAGFANLSSIAVQTGAIGTLAPSRRAEVATLGLRALLAGILANLSNAAIAGMLVTH